MEAIRTFAEYLCFVKESFSQILELNHKLGNTCMELQKFIIRASRDTFMNKENVLSYLRFFSEDFIVVDGLIGLKEDFSKDIIIYDKVKSRIKNKTYSLKRTRNRLLSDEQKTAAEKAPTSDISIITGGAGTGKTTIINHILHNFNQTMHGSEKAFVLTPTGKAAKRAKETITEPCEVSTVDYFAGTGHPLNRRDYQRINSAKFIILDEASMLSAEKFCLLMQITDAPIILVGDVNQLPAVDAGNILKDLITLGVPTYYLTKNYRSNDEILCNANSFIGSEEFEGLQASDNFELIKVSEEEVTKALIDSDTDVILTPFRKEEFFGSSMAINNILHRSRGFSDNLYHVGEPVIMMKNNRKLGYYNGETGYVTAVTIEEIYVDLGDRVVTVKDETELDLNYACTVHKSQGSEYESVAIYCPDCFLMSRNALYTAITRAKKKVRLYYTDDAAFEQIFKRSAHSRSTFLSAFESISLAA